MMRLTGIGASEGIAIGKAYIFREEEIILPEEKTVSQDKVETEQIRLEEAMKKTKTQLISIREKVRQKMGDDKADILMGISCF